MTSYELAERAAELHQLGRKQKRIAKELEISQSKVSRLVQAFQCAGPELREAWKYVLISDQTALHLAKYPRETQADFVEKARSDRAPVVGISGAKSEAIQKLANRASAVADPPGYVRGVHHGLLFALDDLPEANFDPIWEETVK